VRAPDQALRSFELAQVNHAPGRRVERELHVLHALADLDTAVRARIVELVKVCREHGASWSEVGSQLGISKQAAQERFS
jgi:hypothetical protein